MNTGGSGLIELHSGEWKATVNPLGAELTSLTAPDGRNLMWEGDPSIWPGHAPILFPLIGPLNDDALLHHGRTYEMPPHGFLQFQSLTIVDRRPNGCQLQTDETLETLARYPFPFSLSVVFELSEGSMVCTVVVTNSGSEPMPADVGFHPGFKWPFDAGVAKEDYSITFESKEPAPIRRGDRDPIMLFHDPFPTPVEGRTLRLRDELFEAQAMVFDKLNSRSLIYGAPGSRSLRVAFPDCPYLALWMRPGAGFIAIEPWQGLPAELDFNDEFSTKPGIAVLEPGETRRWRLELSVLPAETN